MSFIRVQSGARCGVDPCALTNKTDDAHSASAEPSAAPDDNPDNDNRLPEWLRRPLTLGFGPESAAPHWKNVTFATVDVFLRCLQLPEVSRYKNGNAFLQGPLKSDDAIPRTAENMGAFSIIGFDIDDGKDPDAVVAKLEALGLEAVLYATYSDSPAKRKFRVILVFDVPIAVEVLGATLQERKDTWKALYRIVGSHVEIANDFDESCTDLTRLFFTPRRPKDADFFHHRTSGGPLDSVALVAEAKVAVASAASAKADNAKSSAEADSGKPEDKPKGGKYTTPGLAKFFAVCAKHFNAADFILKYGGDPAAANNGVQARCPNEEGSEHSKGHDPDKPDPPGKRPLFAMNASKSHHGVFALTCRHATCTADLKGPHFVDLLCQTHSIGVDELVEFVTEAGRKAWDDAETFILNDEGFPSAGSQHNVRLALKKAAVKLRFNEFSGKTLITWKGAECLLQDALALDLRLAIDREYAFRPTKDLFFDVLGAVARENAFNPALDYLSEVEAKWDRVPRIERFFTTYFAAEDTTLARATAKCWFVAAVRRVRQPGCKFDEMPVFESPQGKGKSSALAILAVRPEWFTDNLPLGASGKEVIELTQGKWIVEIAELHGMRKAEIDKVKAQLSRQFDEARLAYGHIPERVARQFVFAGTSNNRNYLKDLSGNRRFWPTETGDIDHAALKRDVDQVWGEAATLEAAGETHRLDKSLWAVAAEAQAERLQENPFTDQLSELLGDHTGGIRSTDVWKLLRVSTERQSPDVIDKVRDAMRQLGWGEKKSIHWQGRTVKGYRKGGTRDLKVVEETTGPRVREVPDPNTLRGKAAGG